MGSNERRNNGRAVTGQLRAAEEKNFFCVFLHNETAFYSRASEEGNVKKNFFSEKEM